MRMVEGGESVEEIRRGFAFEPEGKALWWMRDGARSQCCRFGRNFFHIRNFRRKAEIPGNFIPKCPHGGLSWFAHAWKPEFLNSEPRGSFDGTKARLSPRQHCS